MKTKIIICILFGALMASCSDSFLQENDPNKVTSANFWQTEADLNSAMASLYYCVNSQGWGMYGYIGMLDDILRSEDIVIHTTDGADYCIFQNTPTSQHSNEIWSVDYKGLFYANQIIKYGGDMSIDSKGKYVAEAKFFRGFLHYQLVNMFGEVIIYNKLPTTPDDYYKAKSTKAEVWQQVEKDLTDAAAGLPEKRSGSEVGRVTKGTALAYLGRAYLYQEKWAEAQRVLQSIVDGDEAHGNTNGYGLVDDYAQLFDGKHENSKESLFENQIGIVNGKTDYASATAGLLGPSNGSIGAWGLLDVNPAIKDTFLLEKTTAGAADPRAHASIAGNYADCQYYTHAFSDGFFDISKVYIKKYTNWWGTSENWQSELNLYGMRYSDVLLMLAEAYTMQNNVSAAAPLVQRIRTRAKLADKQTAMSSYSKDAMMAEIRHQRQMEFFAEGTHFYDLRRWGLLKDAMANSLNVGKANFVSSYPKYCYYPIPANELSANKNLTQNDPWK